MNITDEQLSAYLDGELPTSDMDIVGEALENNPELAARFEQLVGSNQMLKHALEPMIEEDVPADISALLDGDDDKKAEAITPPQAANDNSLWQRWSLPLAASIALFVGVGIGNYVRNDTGYSADQLAGVIGSQNPLHDILENRPSGETVKLDGNNKAEVILSFANKEGSYCREFTVTGANKTSRAIACRNGNWNIRLSTQSDKAGDNSAYQTASSDSDALFDQFVDSQMGADALNAQSEQILLRRDWEK